MTFSDDLRKRVQKGLGQTPEWGDVNPLTMIGLTETILNLNLTEEQLFVAIRGYVRQLAKHAHTDTDAPNISEDLRGQIFKAFEMLDDRERFSKVLEEFRKLKSSEREEIRTLRESLQSAREQLDRFGVRETELLTAQTILENERREFEREKSTALSSVPVLQAEIKKLNHGYWAKRWNEVYSFVRGLGVEISKDKNAPPIALDARWLATMSLVPSSYLSGTQKERPSFALNDEGEVSSEFLRATKFLGISQNAREKILTEWKERASNFLPNSKDDFRSADALCLNLFALKAGRPESVYGWRGALRGGRVIGSAKFSNKLSGRYQLTYSVDTDSIFGRMTPNLVPGRLIVHQKQMTVGEPSKVRRVVVKLDTRQVILGAE